MVNVKDLMVDNWVKSPQGITQVHNVLTDKIITKNDKRGVNCYHTTDIEPIPVTKEILKKIGFKEEKGLTSLYQYWDESDKYKLNIDDYYTNSDRRWYVQIDNNMCRAIGCGEFDYVHELQNLVRVITRYDLPITKDMLYE
jgi:hypothetical protein